MNNVIRTQFSALRSLAGCCTNLLGVSTPESLHIFNPVRTATKKAQGSTKNTKSSESKRLGVKLFGGQTCKPGSIILRQRGMKWRPADNVGMGKDHTIYSLFHGKVLFSKCPRTKRTQVGVTPYEFPAMPVRKPLPAAAA